MHKLRHLKSALIQPLMERRRLAVSMFIAFVGFAVGVLMPYQRVFAGAAVAAVAVAMTQLIFTILDRKDDDGSPRPPAERPEPSDLT
ncbi:hypothetical protein ACWDDN_48125 [Streptomyces griseoruber]